MNFTIRQIEPTDNPFLATIIRDTLVEFKANHPGTVYYDASTDFLYELFQKKGSTYFVALVENKIVGGAGIFPTDGLPHNTAELVKMYLLPEARAKGLGKMLIEKSIGFAKDKGYENVYLESMPELQKALRVYEYFGFEYLPGPMGNTCHEGCSVWMMKKV